MRNKLIIFSISALALALLFRPAKKSDPDVKIAKHIEALCTIAGDNVNSPKDGVEQWYRYLGDHFPDILKQWGELLVEIERIKDDGAHDRRAEKARGRIHAALYMCEEPLERFMDAVDDDEEASLLLERGLERFVRTLEILFADNAPGDFHLLDKKVQSKLPPKLRLIK